MIPDPKIILFILLLAGTAINAQSGVVAGGGEGSGPGGSVSFSVGQPFYETAVGGVYSSAAGVQQAYEISQFTDILTPGWLVQLSVNPNPTTGVVRVTVRGEGSTRWTCILRDLQGRLLQEHQSSSEELMLNLHSLPSGTYLVQIADMKHGQKTFQIVKTEL
jgi:hypothetical protein